MPNPKKLERMRTSEILFKASKVMQERGHGRNSYVCDDGKVCALGSIFVACGAKVQRIDAYTLVLDYTDIDGDGISRAHVALRRYLSDANELVGKGTIPEWNDSSSSDRVLSAIGAAAVVEKVREEAI